MRLISDVARIVFCIVAGLLFLSQMPIYSMPAAGCDVSGFLTLSSGCSSWPDFLYGLCFVLLFWVAGPKRARPHLWGIAILFLVAAMGGPISIRHGAYLELFDGSTAGLIGWKGPSSALALGGLTAWLLVLFIQKSFRRNASMSR